MSKIALSGPASGTATYTISAPTGATDRTITLPDQTATLITNSSDVLNIGSGQLYKDASGNVGIGTSSPSGRLNIAATAATNTTSVNLTGSTTGYQRVLFSNTTGGGQLGVEGSSGGTIATGTTAYATVVGDYANNPLQFITNNSVRATIDTSGNLLVGTTSNDPGAKRYSVTSSSWGLFARCGNGNAAIGTTNTSGTAAYNAIGFYNNGISFTATGSITVSGSTTAYNTSSDYRLKHDIQSMTGALAKVALLKPCTYKWKVDGSDGEGFIAHELAEVVPQCVSGEKDAVNEDGSIKPQGIDTSFLTATLTAAIQELKAIVDAQATRIAALEGTQP